MKPCSVTDNPSFAAKCIMGEADRWHAENPEALGKSPVVIVLVSNTLGTGLELTAVPRGMDEAQREDLTRALRSLADLFEGKYSDDEERC
jgi:hypothetical protein